MNKGEKEAIEIVKEIRKSDLMSAEFDIEELYNAIQTTLNYIDKLQEENKNYKELILIIKGKLNNIQFEVEQSWRKIEKLESKYE